MEISPGKILHIANFNENADGRLYYSFSNKLNYGFIKNNYVVETISDRNYLKSNRSLFKPFNNPKEFLKDNDIIAFTKNAFEPSHLMEIENILFEDDHPYRYNKIFEFTNYDGKQIKFNYMVRPRDERLTEYDLERIKNELTKIGTLFKERATGIEYIRYKDFKEYVFFTCKNNPLGLLTSESQNLINSICKNGRLESNYFL